MIKTIIAMIWVCLSLSAADLKWEKEFPAAVAKANKEHKPLMVVVNKHGCKWCEVYKKETLQHSKVSVILNRDFVLYEGNMDENTVPNSLMTPGTPGTWFLKGNQPMFAPVMGAVKADDLIPALDEVKKEYAKK